MTSIDPQDRKPQDGKHGSRKDAALDEAQANIDEARRDGNGMADTRTDERRNDRVDGDRATHDRDRAAENNATKDRTAEDRTANDRAAENRATNDRAAEDGATANRSAEGRVSEDRTRNRPDNRIPADQAPVAARTRIFEDSEAEQYRTQWRELQAGFVDEPREAVREADTLVTQMVETLTAQLNEQKQALQGEWDSADTERLRVALQRYRSLFDQMLQV